MQAAAQLRYPTHEIERTTTVDPPTAIHTSAKTSHSVDTF
jgi:hypothetical protein